MTTLHRCAFLLIAAAATLPAQGPPEVAPAVARLIRTYEKTPDGTEFFNVWTATSELKGNGLWVRYGERDNPPVRIDRATGQAKTIGAKGKGPNEFTQPTDLVSGDDGLIGVRDPARRLFFWVDAAGVQRHTWSIPTTNHMQGKTFTDAKRRLFIGMSGFDPGGRMGLTYIVRVDSARGLRDSLAVPFQRDRKWSWTARTERGATEYYVQFAPYPDWGIDRQGRVFAWHSDSNFIQVYDGEKSNRLMLPAWHEPLSAADRKSVTDRLDDIEKREKARGGAFLNERPPVPATRSQILDAMPDLAGGIVVRRSKRCADFKAWRAPITGAAPPDTGRCGFVERFDANGRRLTPFTYTFRDQLLAIRGDTVWMARRDDDELLKILELVIPKR